MVDLTGPYLMLNMCINIICGKCALIFHNTADNMEKEKKIIPTKSAHTVVNESTL